MAFLSDLVSATARALIVDKSSVALCARYLRESGLITQKGRGPSAAHMGPADAVNLLLGIMASPALKDAPTAVRLAREARFIDSQINFRFESIKEDPPYPFLKDDNGARNLGAALDSFVDEVVRFGIPTTDPDPNTGETGLLTNFQLEIRRPGLAAKLMLDNSGRTHIAHFHRAHPDLDNLKGVARQKAGSRIYRKALAGMHITTDIGFDPIDQIAKTLRGYEPQRGEQVRPPYRSANA